jgi:GTPase
MDDRKPSRKCAVFRLGSRVHLLATPTTVAAGYYSSFSKPAITIKSGDTVKMQTLASCGNLAQDGVPADQIPPYIAPSANR